ncbi:DNA-binding protein [Ferrimonas balearica]|uniref:DNA-binding protein n=1 Tax=Ferrimonas balearica TaxID=44012 RepID=UPI001C997A4F|nr:DNA-binding protein [Ferrimonas balearica]MBY5921331.1 DNA-binding protein [Ferrimonas balearica]MBY5995984.1 DNA-binding protein [Ferrimonas balearica]
MKLYLCIDDTDEIGTKGTGELAQELIDQIHEQDLGHCSSITRHQLYVHPDIPYTSHNSAMCFELMTRPEHYGSLTAMAQQFLLNHSAAGSDPGLCIAPLERIDQARLIAFGQAAKRQVLSKAEAYQLAFEMGIHLSEHGGRGDGVIGALAGVGLRLSGRDGRCKGKLAVQGDRLTVAELLRHPEIDAISTPSGERLPADTPIELLDKVKTVWWNHCNTLLVVADGARWINAQKPHLRDY